MKTIMFPGACIGKSAASFYFFAWLAYLPRYFRKAVRSKFKIRTVSYVAKNYDEERSKMLAELDQYNDVRDYCLYPDNVLDFTIIDGKLVYGKLKVSTNNVYHVLEKIVFDKTENGTKGTVIEFGSGFGRNCILLKHNAPALEIYGLELSKVSVELSKAAAKKFNVNANFFQSDVTQPIPPEIPKPEIVFSCHALEQMPEIFESALINMINTGARWIVLLEPVEELYPKSQSGLLQRLRVRVNDRLRGLMNVIEKHELNVLEKYKLNNSVNPLNETCLILIENKLID